MIRTYFSIVFITSVLYQGNTQVITFGSSDMVGLPALKNPNVSWADIDNDGDMDVVIQGLNVNDYLAGIFYNTGNNVFTLHQVLPSWTSASFSWQDIDLDGRVDLIVAAEAQNGELTNYLYRQNESGEFYKSILGLPGMKEVAFVWASYNDDQYPDLVISGKNAQNARQAFVSKNLGNGYFSNIIGFSLTGSFSAQKMEVMPSDYNYDGLMDLIAVTENSIYFFQQNYDGTMVFQSSLRQNGTYSFPLTKSVIDGTGEQKFFLGSEYEVVTEVANGGSYFNANSIIEETVSLSDGEYVFQLKDSYGDGIYSPTGVTLKDALNNTLFEYKESINGPYNILEQAFCIGTGCYQSPLTLLIETDDYPDEISWSVIEAGGISVNGPTQMSVSFFDGVTFNPLPFEFPIYSWFDIDQDGQSDALVQSAPGEWQWLLNQFGTWAPTMTFQSDMEPMVVDANEDGIPEMITTLFRSNGSVKFSLVTVQEALIPYQTPEPIIQFTYVDETTNVAYIYWEKQDPFATYNLTLETNGSIAPVRLTPKDPFGYWEYSYQGQLRLNEIGTHKIHVTAIGANGIPSNSVATDEIITNTRVEENPYVLVQQNFPNLSNIGNIDWIDFDNDGDLDVYIDGEVSPCATICFESALYENQNGNFYKLDITFLPTELDVVSVAEWADFDHDGDLDVIMTITNWFTNVTQTILFEQRDKKFYKINDTPFNGTNNTIKWADYDNDGDMDLAMIREIAEDNTAGVVLYQNEGGTFFQVEDLIYNKWTSSLHWIDFDQDGDFDMAITVLAEGGDVLGGYKTLIFENDFGSFTQTNTSIDHLIAPSLAFGDVDNDGDPDALISGAISLSPHEYKAVLFKNEAGVFVEDQEFEEIWGEVFWNDYDQDGDLDFFLFGTKELGNGENLSLLYRNDNGIFNLTTDNLIDLERPEVGFADFDGDNRTDLLIKGNLNNFNFRTRLYKNNAQNANSTPTTPQNPVAQVLSEGGLSRNSVTISWDPGADNETPENGLEYAVSLWRNGERLTSVMPFDTHGFTTTNRTFNKLPPGFYMAMVQTIDKSFAKSDYSEPVYFEIAEPFTPSGFSAQLSGDHGHISRVDFDNDGDLDVLAFDYEAGTSFYRNENDDFTQLTSPFTNLDWGGNSAWADYDLDGDLDVVVSGQYLVDNSVRFFADLYRNDQGEFVSTNMGLEVGFARVMKWSDYDKDGDEDLFMIGEFGEFFESKFLLFENDQSVLSPVSVDVLPLSNNQFRETITWGDFDNDGDEDFIQCGANELTNGIYKLNFYDNEAGTFVLKSTSLPVFGEGVLSSVDYDADGDLDLFFDRQQFGVRIFKNNGGDFIEQKNAFPIYWNQEPESTWGDYDGDGDLDVLRNGSVWIAELQYGYDEAKLYRNDNGIFSETGVFIEGRSFNFFDHDKDGDLDIYGISPSGQFVLYLNELNLFNAAPTVPAGLEAQQENAHLSLTWESSTDDRTPSSGMGYNIMMKSEQGALVRPSVTPEGKMNQLQLGNTSHNAFYLFKGAIPDGTYNWAVQAIDNSMETSAFTQEQTFTYCYNFENSKMEISTNAESFVKNYNIRFAALVPEESVGIEWDFGDGTVIADQTQPTHIYAIPGSYSVILRATSAFGCVNSRTMTIQIEDAELSSRITTVLTPNGDGKNDFLYVENGTFYSDNVLRIFNMQGQLLHQAKNYQNDWGGTYKGKLLPEGQYIAEFQNLITKETIREIFNILR